MHRICLTTFIWELSSAIVGGPKYLCHLFSGTLLFSRLGTLCSAWEAQGPTPPQSQSDTWSPFSSPGLTPALSWLWLSPEPLFWKRGSLVGLRSAAFFMQMFDFEISLAAPVTCNLHSKLWWESHCFWLWCSSTLSSSESYWNIFPTVVFSPCYCTFVVVCFYCQPVSSLLH